MLYYVSKTNEKITERTRGWTQEHTPCKWNEIDGVLGHLCAHMGGGGDEWDDTALQKQNSKFEPWRPSPSTLPLGYVGTVLNLYEWVGKKHLFLSNLNARAGFEPPISDFPSRQF